MAKKKRSPVTVIIILSVIGFILVLSVAWFSMNKGSEVVLVSVEPVGKRTIVQTVNAIGKLQPEFMVKISSEASGEIVFLGVRDGDTVRQGQLLVKIQPDLVETQLQQASAAAEAARITININKAEVDRTEADLKRVSELYKKDYATKEELDRAKAAYEMAAGRYTQSKASYEQARGALRQTEASANRTTINSPMAGVVTYLAAERGEKVVGTATMQGTEIMRIADLSIMNAWVDVDENDVALLSVGDTARIKVDALQGETFKGVVYEISHSPRTTAQGTQEEVVNFQVRIRLVNPDPRMRPGMSVSVDMETETRSDVLSVPIQAVTVQQKGNGEEGDWRVTDRNDAKKKSNHPNSIVWIEKNNAVQPREIETGISDQGYIEIVKGLQAGESVVTSPFAAVTKLLQPGSAIRVEKPDARKARFDRMRQGQ
jgi:HlyD family secretion protein